MIKQLISEAITFTQGVHIDVTLDKVILIAFGISMFLAIKGLIGWLKENKEQDERCKELLREIEKRLRPKVEPDKRVNMTQEQRWARWESRRLQQQTV